MLERSALEMAKMIRTGEISSSELVAAHLERLEQINPSVNAVAELLGYSALKAACEADEMLASGVLLGPLHGVPISVKDSIDVEGTKTTAGTVGRKNASPAAKDATVVGRLRAAGAIPIAKTNLPDLLFSFETDNLIYGRTNNPYDLSRTPGGSSGGESALIASCGSPLGLGSDCLGSVRVPAAFCGIASIKPTSGRLPRTGHVPPAGGWIEALWQIGPMARHVEDLALAMQLMAGEEDQDFTDPPVPLLPTRGLKDLRIAFFTDNGFAPCDQAIRDCVERCARSLSETGAVITEAVPPGVADAYELELGLLGADGCAGLDQYVKEIGSTEVHPLLEAFLSHMRPFRGDAADLARRWARWDEYRSALRRFFDRFDAILCPAYAHTALIHRESANEACFRGFSYTMAWNLAGAPAATVRCGEANGLPINVQAVAKPWQDLTALEICRALEHEFGGWQAPVR